MEEFMYRVREGFLKTWDSARDGFWKAYDWCMEHKKAALITGAWILALIVLLSIMCCTQVVKDKGEAYGVNWTFYANGTLRFEGEGEVIGLEEVFDESEDTSMPVWYEYRDLVKNIEIGEDVLRVSMDSFVSFPLLEKITVYGEITDMDVECVRYETEEGWEHFHDIIISGRENSSAQSYAEFNSLEFKPF